MKRLFIISSTVFLLTACASAPEPMSWKKDLDNLPVESINDRAKINEIYKELDSKSVWGR